MIEFLKGGCHEVKFRILKRILAGISTDWRNSRDLRKRAVLEVMKSNYSNHIKLSQYAMVADFDSSPNLRYMLDQAIEMDLDANYVISVLENRNLMSHDFIAREVMDFARAQGPYMRKVELANELLRSVWKSKIATDLRPIYTFEENKLSKSYF